MSERKETPAALAGEYEALLADLHELDWGALPAVGRAAAAIEAMQARVAECVPLRTYAEQVSRNARLSYRAEAAEARVVQLEEHASKQAQDIVTLGQLAGRAAVLEARVVQLEAALRQAGNSLYNIRQLYDLHEHDDSVREVVGKIDAALSAPAAKGGDNG
jgi:hypothetical protein